MVQKADKRGNMTILAKLPAAFMTRFYGYLEARRKADGNVHNVTMRSVVFDALKEYMRRNPAQKG